MEQWLPTIDSSRLQLAKTAVSEMMSVAIDAVTLAAALAEYHRQEAELDARYPRASASTLRAGDRVVTFIQKKPRLLTIEKVERRLSRINVFFAPRLFGLAVVASGAGMGWSLDYADTVRIHPD